MVQRHFIKLVTNLYFKNSSKNIRKAANHVKKMYFIVIADNYLKVK